jgi:hypothetical protein
LRSLDQRYQRLKPQANGCAFKAQSKSVTLMTADNFPAKKSPYHEDTGIPDLLLPRCAHGITSDSQYRDQFPVVSSGFIVSGFCTL